MNKNNVELNVAAIRKQTGLTQDEFWRRVGTTQAGGSRYEKSGRISPAMELLITLIHIKGLDPATFNIDDHTVGQQLRAKHPQEYQRLLKEVQRWSVRKQPAEGSK